MARDSLAALIKIRRVACDEALRKLVETLANEDRAQQTVHAVERAIAFEMEAVSSPESSDAAVEAFGAWLPEARRQLAAARHALQDRQVETVRTRAELTACRTALETVETLQTERRETVRRTVDKQYERDLEDRPQDGHPQDGQEIDRDRVSKE